MMRLVHRLFLLQPKARHGMALMVQTSFWACNESTMAKSTNGSRAAQLLSCPSNELDCAKQINPQALAGETNVVEDGTV